MPMFPPAPRTEDDATLRLRAAARRRVAAADRRADRILRRVPARLPRRTRFDLTAILLTMAAAGAAFQLLVVGHVRQSAALFVGLPVVLGLLTIQLTRTATPLGTVIQGSIIFLAIVAPLLGEGSICLLMAAPLFIGVAVVVALLLKLIAALFVRPSDDDFHDRRLHCFAWILLPIAWGMAERAVAPAPAAPLVVRSVETVDGSLDEWRILVRTPVVPAGSDSTLLRLGLPLPVAYEADGDVATLTFVPRPMPGGEWRLARAVQPDGIDFVLLDDTTMVAEWLALREHRVRVTARPDGRVDVEQTTVFVPRLAPHWYFDTAERWAMEAAHRLAIDSWVEARRRGAVPRALIAP
jgi:hypothetical protein